MLLSTEMRGPSDPKDSFMRPTWIISKALNEASQRMSILYLKKSKIKEFFFKNSKGELFVLLSKVELKLSSVRK